jgi:hypothetical protein
VDVWLYTRSANEVSGDLVDVLALAQQRTVLVLADVAGKGLSAALLSAKLQATVRALVFDTETLPSLGDLGERVNHIMYRDRVRGRFATMVGLLTAADSGTVRLVNAGHMAPLVVRPHDRGTAARFGRDQDGAGRRVCRAVCRPARRHAGGHSDGVTEAMNEARGFFGDERLRSVLGVRAARVPPRSARPSSTWWPLVGDAPCTTTSAHHLRRSQIFHHLLHGVRAACGGA